MRKATVEVFKASELSPKAQENARQRFFDLWDSNDADAITEMFKQSLADAGLSDLEPHWSLSNCQGDGVAFYGVVNLEELEKAGKDADMAAWFVSAKLAGVELEDFQVEVTSISSHYNHWNTMRTSVIAPDGEEGRGESLCKLLDALLVDLSRKMEKEGYEEIEYRMSMESFLEAAEANEWEFTKDGKLF